jgi:hypothetical protein
VRVTAPRHTSWRCGCAEPQRRRHPRAFRLRPVTEGGRLTRYHEVLAGLKIDALQAEYATATAARRVELAEQISSKQVEANFYTYEANIGPGSLKLSGSRGLEIQESYQAALTQLEMIEHIPAEAGGNVALASRVTIRSLEGPAGHHTKVSVLFHK